MKHQAFKKKDEDEYECSLFLYNQIYSQYIN